MLRSSSALGVSLVVPLLLGCGGGSDALVLERDGLARRHEALLRDNRQLRAGLGDPSPAPASDRVAVTPGRVARVVLGQPVEGPWFRAVALESKRCGDESEREINLGVRLVIDNLSTATIDWFGERERSGDLTLVDAGGTRYPRKTWSMKIPRCRDQQLGRQIASGARAEGWVVFTVPEAATGLTLHVPIREPHGFGAATFAVDLAPERASRQPVRLPDLPALPTVRRAERTVRTPFFEVHVEALRVCAQRADGVVVAADLSVINRATVPLNVRVDSIRDAAGRDHAPVWSVPCGASRFPDRIEVAARGSGVTTAFLVPAKSRGAVARVAVSSADPSSIGEPEEVDVLLGDVP